MNWNDEGVFVITVAKTKLLHQVPKSCLSVMSLPVQRPVCLHSFVDVLLGSCVC